MRSRTCDSKGMAKICKNSWCLSLKQMPHDATWCHPSTFTLQKQLQPWTCRVGTKWHSLFRVQWLKAQPLLPFSLQLQAALVFLPPWPFLLQSAPSSFAWASDVGKICLSARAGYASSLLKGFAAIHPLTSNKLQASRQNLKMGLESVWNTAARPLRNADSQVQWVCFVTTVNGLSLVHSWVAAGVHWKSAAGVKWNQAHWLVFGHSARIYCLSCSKVLQDAFSHLDSTSIPKAPYINPGRQLSLFQVVVLPHFDVCEHFCTSSFQKFPYNSYTLTAPNFIKLSCKDSMKKWSEKGSQLRCLPLAVAARDSSRSHRLCPRPPLPRRPRSPPATWKAPLSPTATHRVNGWWPSWWAKEILNWRDWSGEKAHFNAHLKLKFWIPQVFPVNRCQKNQVQWLLNYCRLLNLFHVRFIDHEQCHQLVLKQSKSIAPLLLLRFEYKPRWVWISPGSCTWACETPKLLGLSSARETELSTRKGWASGQATMVIAAMIERTSKTY